MLPKYQQYDSKPYLSIRFGNFAVAVVALPFLAFVFCVVWSLVFFFNESTGTHCGAFNYLPSISAAIGNYQPQRFVWQTAILLQAIPRLMITYQYRQHYKDIIRRNHRPLAYLACVFNVIENLALVGLSMWTSITNYEIHKTCFITFVATSELYMLMSYLLHKNAKKSPGNLTEYEVKSLKYKRKLFIMNVISILVAAYFFMRHNDKCEHGAYTVFAFFEYIVVLTNMGFHMTSLWDFHDQIVIVDGEHGIYITSHYLSK